LRLVVQAIVAAVCLLLAPRIWADAQKQLDIATTRYQNGRYEEAADILSKLLSVPADPSTPEGLERQAVNRRARPYYAATLHALGRVDEARVVALEQYRDDPFFELPAGQFPPPVTELFIEVEAENRDEIEELQGRVMADKQDLAARRARLEKARAERLRELERLASEEVEIVHRSRWIAAVPFGVGQFQNDDYGLGAFFLIGETLTLGAAIASAGVAWDTALKIGGPKFDDQGNTIDKQALVERYQVAQVVNWVSFGACASLVVAGIIEAQVSFEGTTVTRKKRPIPPPVVPDAIVTESGVAFGLTGHF
jgi:tetratricopeptide (TPR) repeat protein